MSSPITSPEEQKEVYDLCFRGRLGRPLPGDGERVQVLYKKDPDGYARIAKKARSDADATVRGPKL